MADKRMHIQFHAPILEMGDAIEYSSMVQVDNDLLKQVTEGDDTPQFVISVIDEQKSKKKINYDTNALELIAEQVNTKQPTGYLGHIKDQDRDTALPMPQVLWLAARVIKGAKARLVTKGYLIPEGSARNLIKRRVINTVSWQGDAKLVPTTDGYNLIEFDLESIDFARKNREGMRGQSLALVTEMSDDEGGKVAERADEDYERIVSHLVLADLNAHNPALVKTIREMAKDEVKDETATAVKEKEEELNDAHKKELEALPEVTTMQKIMDLLEINKIEDAFEAVVKLVEKLDDMGKQAVKSWFESEILAKKVPNERARKLIGRLIPVTEMQGEWRTDTGVEKIKKDLEERVDDALENDDEVKMIITEMGSQRGGLRITPSTRQSDDKGKSGNNDSGIKPTDNFDVEEVAVG